MFGLTQAQADEFITKLCTILGVMAGSTIPLTKDQIGTVGAGLQGIVGLVFLVYSVYATIKAGSTKGVLAKAAAVAKDVPGTRVITSDVIAKSMPQQNIQSLEDVKVVAITSPGTPVTVGGVSGLGLGTAGRADLG